jgi:hypothetical protein
VKLMVTQLLKKLWDKFMKLRGLLLYSQELATGSYPVRWIQVTSSHPISLRSVLIIFCLWRSSKLSVPSRLSKKKFVWIFHLSSTCYMPPIILKIFIKTVECCFAGGDTMWKYWRFSELLVFSCCPHSVYNQIEDHWYRRCCENLRSHL